MRPACVRTRRSAPAAEPQLLKPTAPADAEARGPRSLAAASTLIITLLIASSRRSRIGPDPTISSSRASRRSWAVDSLIIPASWVGQRLPSIAVSGFPHRVSTGRTVRVKRTSSTPTRHGSGVRGPAPPDGRLQRRPKTRSALKFSGIRTDGLVPGLPCPEQGGPGDRKRCRSPPSRLGRVLA